MSLPIARRTGGETTGLASATEDGRDENWTHNQHFNQCSSFNSVLKITLDLCLSSKKTLKEFRLIQNKCYAKLLSNGA